MSFTLKSAQTFTWPVVAYVPTESKHRKVTFDATFNIVSPERVNELLEDGSMAILKEALVAFTGMGIEDEVGNEIPEDNQEERCERILLYPFMVTALSDAYAEGIAGRKGKN